MSNTNPNYQGLSALQITRFGGIAFAAACIWAANYNWFSFAIPDTYLVIYQSLFDFQGGVYGNAIVFMVVGYVIAAWVDQLIGAVCSGLGVGVIVAVSYFMANLDSSATLTSWAIVTGIGGIVMAGVAGYAASDVKKMKDKGSMAESPNKENAKDDIEVTESFSAD